MRPAAGCARCRATPLATSAPWPVSVSSGRPRVLGGGHRAEPGRRVGRRAVVLARLRGDHARHDAPGPHAARVDVEVVEVVGRVGLDAALLRLQHHLVLEEDARHALPQPRRDHLLVEAPVAGEGPQVEAGAVGLGRHRVDHGAVDALAAVALQGAGARLRDAHVDGDRRRRGVADDLPPVDGALVVGEPVLQVALPERRRVDAEHPLRDRDGAFVVGDLEIGLRQRVVADARPVHELLVGEVHQVVDDELVAAVDVDRLAVTGPVGVVVPVQVRARGRGRRAPGRPATPTRSGAARPPGRSARWRSG